MHCCIQSPTLLVLEFEVTWPLRYFPVTDLTGSLHVRDLLVSTNMTRNHRTPTIANFTKVPEKRHTKKKIVSSHSNEGLRLRSCQRRKAIKLFYCLSCFSSWRLFSEVELHLYAHTVVNTTQKPKKKSFFLSMYKNSIWKLICWRVILSLRPLRSEQYLVITSEISNQHGQNVLFTCVV